MLSCRVIPLELVDPYYYHLDTCFCPLAPGMAIYYPAAFDEYGQRVLPEIVAELIAVDEEEARRFACNAVVVGNTVVTNTGCPNLHGNCGIWVMTARDAAGRIRQSRRQRQMPDTAARWRRSGLLEESVESSKKRSRALWTTAFADRKTTAASSGITLPRQEPTDEQRQKNRPSQEERSRQKTAAAVKGKTPGLLGICPACLPTTQLGKPAFTQWESEIPRIRGFSRPSGPTMPRLSSPACSSTPNSIASAKRLGTYAFLKTAEDTANSTYQRMIGRYRNAASRRPSRQLHSPRDHGDHRPRR